MNIKINKNGKKNCALLVPIILINRKVFYIMKVIYIYRIYRALAYSVRIVQQSLYMGKPKYILEII